MDSLQQHGYMRAPPLPPPPPPSMTDPSPRPPLPPPSQSTWYPNNQFQYQPPPPQPTWPNNNSSDHLHQHPPPPPPPPHQQHPYPPQPQNQYYPPHHQPPPPPLYPHSHATQSYPQPNTHQTWGNPNQPLHQVWEHPDRNDPNNNEDWAAKARAWSAAKSAMENQHQPSQFTHIGRPEEQNYGFQDQYQPSADPHYTNFQQPSLPASSHQQFAASLDPHMIPANHMQESSSFSSGQSSYYAPDQYASYASSDGALGADPNSVYSHQGNIPTNSSEYQQEVPSSYSSFPGKGVVGSQNVPLHATSSFPISSGQETQYHVPPTLSAPGRTVSEEQPYFAYGVASAGSVADPSDRPLEFAPGFNRNHELHDQHPHSSYMHPDPYSTGSDPAGSVGYVDHLTPVSSIPSLTPPVVPGMGYPPSGLQFDSSFVSPAPVFGQIHGANFRPNLPSSGTGFGLSAGNVHHTAAFPGDLNGITSVSDRPKKAVPNWLREEIIKTKAVMANASQAPREEDPDDPAEEDDSEKSFVKHGPSERKSIDSSISSDEDDDEDAIEAARTAAINQEIKRVLTEVLLKVTDELFDEIATKVLNEDDPSAEVGHSSALPKQKMSSSPPPFSAPKASAKVLIPSKTKESKSDDFSAKSPSVSAGGDILGLGNYASDDEEYDETVHSVKSTRSHMDAAPSPTGNELSGNMREVVENGDSRAKTKYFSTSGTIDNYQDEVGLSDSSIKPITWEKELRNDESDKLLKHGKDGLPKLHEGDTRIQEGMVSTNTESLVDATTPLKPKDAGGKDQAEAALLGDVSSKSAVYVNQVQSKSDRNQDMERKRKSSSKDIVKDAGSGDLKVNSKHSGSGEGSREDRHARKERKEDKNGVKDRGSKSEDRTRESDYRRNSHSKDDRPENVKGRKDSTKDDSGRKRVLDKEDRPRHHGGRDSSIHKRRNSPSVGSRAGNGKDNSVASHDNESSDESSEDSRRRKKHSRKRSLSPSPNRSKRRGRRSRSKSPVRRRR